MKLKINKRDIKIISIALIAGLLFGWLFFHQTKNTNETSELHDHQQEVKETIWTCSMHPQIKQNKTGLCPICAMDLVPMLTISSDEEDISPAEIGMSESAIKLANIQTTIVQKGIPEMTVHLLGKVQPDERNISELTARFGGRIEKLNINYTGQHVKKGEKLATIYSPVLVTAQKELIEALKYKESNPAFYQSAKSKMKLWDLTDEQIAEIEKWGEPQIYFDILSPITGTVTMRHVTLGDYVKEGSALFEVINLSKVWVMFDAYERDLPWIRINDKVEFTLQSLPGKIYEGKVKFIDPFINANTRVAQVRVELSNAGLILKPEMFANGILTSKHAEKANEILIPKSSVLWTGKRAVVYVKIPEREIPSFIYREITLGPEAGNFYVVSEGLNEGEEIALNGVFKIDAAAQLAGKPSMMNPEGGKVITGHQHGDMPGKDKEMTDMDNTTGKKEIAYTDIPNSFKTQLSEVIHEYLKLKDALVATDASHAESEAQNTLDALNKVDMTLLSPDPHNDWMKMQKLIMDNLSGIIHMKGVEMKRSHFSIVSDKLIETIKKFGTGHDEKSNLYIQFCPMAFNDKGAFWVSDEKEIRNPYFGDLMMKCGEVREEL